MNAKESRGLGVGRGWGWGGLSGLDVKFPSFVYLASAHLSVHCLCALTQGPTRVFLHDSRSHILISMPEGLEPEQRAPVDPV